MESKSTDENKIELKLRNIQNIVQKKMEIIELIPHD